jgi:hypothetical protein
MKNYNGNSQNRKVGDEATVNINRKGEFTDKLFNEINKKTGVIEEIKEGLSRDLLEFGDFRIFLVKFSYGKSWWLGEQDLSMS